MKQILCIILAMLLLLLTGGTTLAEEMAGKWGVDFLGYGSDNCLPESFIYWFNDVWALGGAFGFRFDGRPDDSGYFLGASVLKVLKEYEGVRWETKLGVYYDKEFFYSGDDYYVKAYEKIILGAGVGVECFIGSKHSINGFLEYTGAQKISTYSDGSITNNFDAGIQYSVFLRWYK